MTNAEVHQIKAGPILGEISRVNAGGAKMDVFDLRKGLLPEQLAGRTSVHAFIASERSIGYDEVAVVIDETDDGKDVAIELRARDVIDHPEDLQGVFEVAMEESGIDTRTAYIEASILPNGTLERLGVDYSPLLAA